LIQDDMNFVFIHQTCPGQYQHVVRHLQQTGHEVVFITQRVDQEMPGLRILQYTPAHPMLPPRSYALDVEGAALNALAVARICDGLKRDGFVPDIVVGHTGWGELMFVKDVWPNVPLLGYFEFFYRASGSDLNFDQEFPATADDAMRVRIRNSTNFVSLDAVDWGHTPTDWQRDQYPALYHPKISVIHEGVDTELVRPEPSARLYLKGRPSLSQSDQVITYSARRLEPYRGFHVFMRALPKVLSQCPEAQVVIIGGDGVAYGRMPVSGRTWRDEMLAELGDRLDLSRVHFLGWLPYVNYQAVLQLSSAHVYMTYPFVLSWGLLEAMATGCLIIGSRTPPVEEVVADGKNGFLFDFFDTDELAERICTALRNREAMMPMRHNARRTIVEQYDLKTICLPAHLALLRRLTGSGLGLASRRRTAGAPRRRAVAAVR
jgi:glycosyltransferase involved in cell wall biosynthesis